MGTIALAVAGAAVGSALLPAGVTVLGVTLSGAMIGGQIGALAGSYIDQSLLGGSGQSSARGGPRLDDLHVTASTEGAAVPRLIGRARLGGQVIWASPLEEEILKNSSGGGKGGSSGGSTRSYRYYANFAVALCEGTITSIGRVWADGKELDLTQLTWRLYIGTETQAQDDLIVAHMGAEQAPAYRGTAYIVFERMLLESYGNRLPQLSFEVFRAVDPFEQSVRAVVMIPGSGEFVYATTPVTRRVGPGQSETENAHTLQGHTDWHLSLDQLASTLPNVGAVSLVVSWFGTDLRASQCQVRPAVDNRNKSTEPLSWSVAGLTRSSAPLISHHDGRPAYGGTPSDQTVIAAIQDLKARGHKVTLNPFILMDVPEDNARPNPYDPDGPQPAYPWRGRITVHPAPALEGTPDKTGAAASQIAAFVGTAARHHFSIAGHQVVYAGPAEWSFRRMILHYAHLAAAAGGVDGFILCSELRGLTQARASASGYPFVDALIALAADVRAILGPATKITYGADWSEYFGHHPQDGSGDIFFHLDPLWASPNIDAIGIDAYWPLADWRDGRDHADWHAGHRVLHDLSYLKSNLVGGEGYDWYYASDADRDLQIRTPITDGHADKPWVFRFKDIRSWWQNAHFDRPGGIESATPTAWIPQSKPFWLTEIGCPAIDKSANQPNVFVDPKSTESARPYFSTGIRDDLMQRLYLQALTEGLDPTHPGYIADANPASPLYGAPMVDLDHVYIYAWDARPYPAFPNNRLAWGDGANWRHGHWLNGRIASQPLGAVVSDILRSHAFERRDVTHLAGVVPGYVIDQIMSAREALQPLELAYFFDSLESEGRIVFRHRGIDPPVLSLTASETVELKPGADLIALARAQETDLPASARIAYAASERDYRRAVAEARRLVGASGRISLAELAIVMEADQASQIAESWLFETWAARERAQFALPPSRIALEPGDIVALDRLGDPRLFRITEIGDHGSREIDAIRSVPEVYAPIIAAPREADAPLVTIPSWPSVAFLDLPMLLGNEPPDAGYFVAMMRPWPGAVALYSSPETSGFTLRALATLPATMGETVDDLAPGPPGRLDKANALRVRLDYGTLASVSDLALLSGANAAAIEHAPGHWEILQFREATLVAPSTYALTMLIRGQQGTEGTIVGALPAGARFVLLDAALTSLDLGPDDIGLLFNWRFGPSNRDLGTPSYDTVVHAFAGVGRRPFAPVHVRGRRE
ncbi:MAG: glycoside hydrolase/phage tail family protein, partial [Hyphomicrobium sp.]|nr:glycoside hydrolase/phage tail family protein [Hyphomicrobium sp.]